MSNPQDSTPPAGRKKVIKIQYEEMSAKYAAHFVVDRTEDAYLLGFSTGVVEDSATGTCLLPVHSRIALSEAGMRKLAAVLQDAIKQKGSSGSSVARVPRIDDSV